MKKGFTMIELIFVIVILGILASVAVPRLAGTKVDAEISAAAANLRTLVSDAGAYYVVKKGFGTGSTSTKWNEFTNVPLKLQKADGTATTTDGIIKIGGKDCIRVRVQNRSGNVPAHILFLKDKDNKNSGACKQVVEAPPIKAYFDSRVAGVKGLSTDKGAIPIGPSTSMYEEIAAAPKPTAKPAPAKPAPIKVAAAPAVAKPATPAPAVAKPARPAPAVAATPKPVAPKPTPAKPAAAPTPAPTPAPKPEVPKPRPPYSAASLGGKVIKGSGSGSSSNPGLANSLLGIQQGARPGGSGGSVAPIRKQKELTAEEKKEWEKQKNQQLEKWRKDIEKM